MTTPPTTRPSQLTGDPMSVARPLLVLSVVLLLAASAVMGAFVVLVEVPTEVWNTARAGTKIVSLPAAALVAYRLAMMAFDPSRWREERGVHLLLWFAYITVSLALTFFSAVHYENVAADASAASGGRFLLTLLVIVLALWWPHPRRWTPHRSQVPA